MTVDDDGAIGELVIISSTRFQDPPHCGAANSSRKQRTREQPRRRQQALRGEHHQESKNSQTQTQGESSPSLPNSAARSTHALNTHPQNDEDAAKNLEHLTEAGIIRDRQKVNGKYELPDWVLAGMSMEQIAAAKGGCIRCGK